MDIQQLRHFLAAARHANIGVAARAMHITVSGLSRSIKALEDSLGLPLFTRTARGVEPTSHGLKLVPWAQGIVNQRDRVVDEFANLRQARSGVLRFGVTMNFAGRLAPHVVEQLLRDSPGLEVTVATGSQTDLTARLQTAELDFVFGTCRQRTESESLTYDPLQLSRSGVFCRAGHPWAARESLDAASLAAGDWALIDSRSSRQAFQEYFTSRSLPLPRLAACSNSLEFIVEIVQRANLLTNLPETLVAPYVRSGVMVQLRAEPPAGHATVGFVFRVGHVETPAMRAAIGLIRAQVQVIDVEGLAARTAAVTRPERAPSTR